MKALVAAILGVICLVGSQLTCFAQGVTPPKIEVLREIVESLSAAGKVVSSLTDGVAHLVKTSASGYSYISAERERNRLIDISARATNLGVGPNVAVVRSIDEYLAKQSPTSQDWQAVQQGVTQTLTTVTDLLRDVRSERSDFILEPAYRQLTQTLNSRGVQLNKLSTLAQPSTPAELNALRDVGKEYSALIAQLLAAIDELNAYLKNKKPT